MCACSNSGSGSSGGVINPPSGGGGGVINPPDGGMGAIVTDIDPANPFSYLGVYKIGTYSIINSGGKKLMTSVEPTTSSQFRVNVELPADNPLAPKILMSLKLNQNPEVLFSEQLSLTSSDMADLNGFIAKTFEKLGAKVTGKRNIDFTMSAEAYPDLVKNGILKSGETLVTNLDKIRDLQMNEGLADKEPIKVTAVKLDSETAKIDLKMSQQRSLRAEVLPADATNTGVTFTSSDEAVATVSAEGLIIAKKSGTVTITAASVENPAIKATCTVEVIDTTVRVTGVTVNPKTMTFTEGAPVQKLDVTILPVNADNKKYTAASSDTSVATINPVTLEVLAKKAGTATITVKTNDGNFTDTVVVTVSTKVIEVTEIADVALTYALEPTKTLQLSPIVEPTNATVKTLTYSSSNTAVATIDESGLITAVGVGKSTITVSANNGVKAELVLTVETKVVDIPVANITSSVESVTIEVGDSKSFTVGVLPVDATDKTVTASIDNPAVATLTKQPDGSYSVNAINDGDTRVTLTSINGIKKYVTVRVNRVLKLNGTYSVKQVDITKSGTTKIFTNISNASEFSGEAVISPDAEGKPQIKGRFQFTPLFPQTDYIYNDDRYTYFYGDLSSQKGNAGYYKQNLEDIEVNGKKEVVFTFVNTATLASFKITMEKVGDTIAVVLEDKTIYVTTPNVNDVKSMEGRYIVNKFYSSPRGALAGLYGAVASECTKPSSTDAPSGAQFIDCKSGAVGNFKGEMVVLVENGASANGLFTATSKMQMNNHKALDVAKSDRYSYTKYTPVPIDFTAYPTWISNDSANKGVDGSNDAGPTGGNPNSTYDFKVDNGKLLSYLLLVDKAVPVVKKANVDIMTYSTKISDRYTPLSSTKYFPDYDNNPDWTPIPEDDGTVKALIDISGMTAEDIY